ncbi:MAG: PIN domain-containing protein [Caulobacteraceae bacterium]|nr:PIN domain-containing protein [Caulobacteraceae bacterium]
MGYLLDTNVLIHLRDGDPTLTQRVVALEGAILMSIVSQIELEGGVYRDPKQVSLRRPRVDVILQTIPVLSFDEAAALAYRTILETAGYSRRKLLDRMIAAQALVHRAKLVTLNAAGFQDIAGLEVLAW